MPDNWERRVLAKIVHKDETARIIGERERVKEKLRRLGKAFVDGLFDENEYHRQKKSMEWELESLLIPKVDAAKEAGLLLQEMPRLWTGATHQERHQLLTTVLDAVYIDMKGSRSIVSIKAKPAFKVLLEILMSDASTTFNGSHHTELGLPKILSCATPSVLTDAEMLNFRKH
ncbi:MAG: hypothetical protein OTJ43_09165 [Dehalococcoidia bacterium]|nr:hypothetical protein [Dehalococcoidia bacterium]